MSTYIIRRVLLSIPALLGVTIVIFVALRVMPGDPVSVMFGTQATQIRPEDRAKIEADLGLSLPLIVQYGTWLQDIISGKLGRSFWRGDTSGMPSGTPVTHGCAAVRACRWERNRAHWGLLKGPCAVRWPGSAARAAGVRTP